MSIYEKQCINSLTKNAKKLFEYECLSFGSIHSDLANGKRNSLGGKVADFSAFSTSEKKLDFVQVVSKYLKKN